MPKTIVLPSTDTVLIVDAADYARVAVHGWCMTAAGYIVAHVGGRVVQLNRFLLDVSSGMVVVHLKGGLLDFRRENLRVVNRSTMMQRQKKRAGSTSKYKGVQLHRKSGRWRAIIWHGELQRNVQLGYFDSEMEAARAYDEAARKYYGEDAWVNLG